MTTRPTDTPEWSTTGAITEPAAAKQAAGWDFEERPPFDWINWGWNRFALWAAHFAGAASKFATQEGAHNAPATAPLIAGDTCIIVEPGDYTGIPGERAYAVDAGIFATNVIAMGDEVLYHEPGNTEAYARDGSGSLGVYPNNVIAGTVRIRADDRYLIAFTAAVPPANNIEIYDRTTRALLASTSAGLGGGVPGNVVLGKDLFWVATNNVGTTTDVHAFNYAGVLQWSYNHANASANGVRGMAHFGRYLYLYGDASTHASLATMRSIEAATGKDAAGEGGLGTSTLPGVWDSAALAASGASGVKNPNMVTDGRILVIADVLSANVWIRSPWDGASLATWSAPRLDSVAIDRDNLYVSTAGDGASIPGEVRAHSRIENHALIWAYQSTDAAFNAAMGVSSDGSAVFIEDRSGTATIRGVRLYKRNDPRLWARVDPTADAGLPYRREVI